MKKEKIDLEDEIINVCLLFLLIFILSTLVEGLFVPLFCIFIPVSLYRFNLYFESNNYNSQGSSIIDKRYIPNGKIKKIINRFYNLPRHEINAYNDFKRNFKTLNRVVNQENKQEEINLNNFRISNDKLCSFNWFTLGLIEYSINTNFPKDAIYYLTNAINEDNSIGHYKDCYYACRGFIFQESGNTESAYSDFKSAFIFGNWDSLLVLLFEYEEKIVEELDNHLKTNLDQNAFPSLEFENFITFFLNKLKEYGINFTQLGIDESGNKLLLINEEEGNTFIAKEFISNLVEIDQY